MVAVALFGLLPQPELPDGAALRTESRDSLRRVDAVGAEVEIAIGPDHVHVREVEPGRDHRGGSLLGIELYDVAREWVRGTRRRPQVDESGVLVPVVGAAGHVLDVLVIDTLRRSAVYPVHVAGKSSQPDRIARLRDAGGHLIGWELSLTEREVVEDLDAATVADEIQGVRSGIGDIGSIFVRQDAVWVGVMLLVPGIGGEVVIEGAHPGDLAPGAVSADREQGSGLLLCRGEVRLAFRVARGALIVCERLREHAKDRHQVAVTCGDPVHAQGLALAGRKELGGGEQVVDEWGVRSASPIHPRDLRGAPKTDHGLGAETILATVAGLAHHQRALEEFNAPRAIEPARDKRGRGRTRPGRRCR